MERQGTEFLGWERDNDAEKAYDHTLDGEEYADLRDILIQVVRKGAEDALEEAERRAGEDRARLTSMTHALWDGRWLREIWRSLRRHGTLDEVAADLPPAADLTEWFQDVQDQGNFPSCTAHAVIGLVEYAMIRKSGVRPADGGRHVRLSRMFLYKNSIALGSGGPEYVTAAIPLQPRSAFGALVHLGVPPETYWRYTSGSRDDAGIAASFEREPTPFQYAVARGFSGQRYVRLDTPNVSNDNLLGLIKVFLVAGVPLMCGFDYYRGPREIGHETGSYPPPPEKPLAEDYLGGHAIVIVGYDDERRAFRFRNSFGTDFQGEGCAPGYGWLAYEYVSQLNHRGRRLAEDWWALLQPEWLAPQFGLPF